MKKFAILVALFAASANAAGQAPVSQSANRLAQREAFNVYEAVVRYQVNSWDLRADSYCVGVNSKDADKALLQRLAPLPVKGRSGCQQQVDRTVKPLRLMRVVDKKTKRNSVIFDLQAIKWLSDSEVEVEGGYDCGSECMASGVYHAVRNGSTWRVTRFEPRVMS